MSPIFIPWQSTNTDQPNELSQPTIKDTALWRVPIWAYDASVGRFLNKPELPEDEDDSSEEQQNTPTSSSDTEDFEVLEKVKTNSQIENGKAVRRKKSTRGR